MRIPWKRGNHNFTRGIPGASKCKYLVGFRWTDYTLWIWASTTNHSFESQWPHPPNPSIVLNTLNNVAMMQSSEDYSHQSLEPSDVSQVHCPYWAPLKAGRHSRQPRRAYWIIFSSEFFDSNEPWQVIIFSNPSFTPPPLRRGGNWA